LLVLVQALGMADPRLLLLDGHSREAMTAANAVILASGTAALEAMLLKRPMLVCYRMAPLSYFFISRMLRVPYFSLPNLLAGEALVEELVQEQVSEAALVERATRLLAVTGQDSLLQTYRDIHLQLRQDASQKAAEAVLGIL
jgi:lipid-A-disaccharide synthase